MRGIKAILLLLLSVTLLSACNDYDKMANKIVEDNKRKEDIMVKVGQSQTVADSLKDVIIESIVDQNIERLEKSERLGVYENLSSDVMKIAPTIIDEINFFVDQENEFQQSLLEDGKVDTIVELNYVDFTKENLRYHLFMDDKTGVVEQMFFIRLTGGKVYGFSLFWLGGVYIGSEYNNS